MKNSILPLPFRQKKHLETTPKKKECCKYTHTPLSDIGILSNLIGSQYQITTWIII